MSFRRVAGLGAIALATVLWMACGAVYRPVVIPVAITPPDSQNFHAVFGVSTNAQINPGSAMQIDVSGDTNIGQANMGINPTFAATLPNFSRVFVTSAGSIFFGQADIVTAFTPAADSLVPTGLGTPTIFTLPNVPASQLSGITAISQAGNVVTATLSNPLLTAQVGGTVVISGVLITGQNVPNPNAYDGNFTLTAVNGASIQFVCPSPTPGSAPCTIAGLPAAGPGGTATVAVPLYCSYLPDFVTTTQNTAVYVANYGAPSSPSCNVGTTDSVAMLNPSNNSIANIVYLPGGSHPIAMVETPNAENLYVINQGTDSIADLSPVDLTTMATISFPAGAAPVWEVARADNQRIYVVTEGSGTLVPIDTATNTIVPSQTNLNVGVGANFVFYDPTLNRLYVTNPSNGTLYIFSVTGGVDPSGNPNDTPTLLATIPMNAGPNPPCPNGCSPVSVTALPDGTRFYVASYELQGPAVGTICSDPIVGAASDCLIPRLTVFDGPAMTVQPISSAYTLLPPSLSLLSSSQYASTQYALPVVPSCAPAAAYAPGDTRFRMFTTDARDGSNVYVSLCDAGHIAVINTATSTLTVSTNNVSDTLITDLVAPFAVCNGTCPSVTAITGLSINSNIVTLQGLNNFTPGTRVAISNLTSAAGSQLNGQTLTVLAAGLSATQFECNVSAANAGATPDNGTAVPITPLQSPIFLLTGP